MSRTSRVIATWCVVGVILLAGCASDGGTSAESGNDLGFAGAVLPIPMPRPAGTLVDTEGATYDFAAETSGEMTVLFFGYTSCPDVCPVNLSTLATALEELGGELERTKVVFVGVDTARDTPEAMRTYLDAFDPRFIGLTGDTAVMESMMTDLNLPPVLIEPPDAEGNYAVGHASQMVVFTPDDLAHVVYPFGTRTQDWVADLPRLADAEWPEPPT